MYDELVKRLRYCADSDNHCSECKYQVGSPDGSKMCLDLLMVDASDAIEELSKRVPPVPHGRLIDADALLDDLLFPSKQFEQGRRELIADAPTIIPAEPPKDEAPTGPYDLLYEEGGPNTT